MEETSGTGKKETCRSLQSKRAALRMRSRVARCRTCPVPPTWRFKGEDCRRARDTARSGDKCSGESQAQSWELVPSESHRQRRREVMRPLLHKKLGGKLRRPAFNTPVTAPCNDFSSFSLLSSWTFCPTAYSSGGFLKLGLAAAGFCAFCQSCGKWCAEG